MASNEQSSARRHVGLGQTRYTSIGSAVISTQSTCARARAHFATPVRRKPYLTSSFDFLLWFSFRLRRGFWLFSHSARFGALARVCAPNKWFTVGKQTLNRQPKCKMLVYVWRCGLYGQTHCSDGEFTAELKMHAVKIDLSHSPPSARVTLRSFHIP